MKMPPATPYGVPIREVIATGDADLMNAMAQVSSFMKKSVAKNGGQPDEDWNAAHAALERAAK